MIFFDLKRKILPKKLQIEWKKVCNEKQYEKYK